MFKTLAADYAALAAYRQRNSLRFLLETVLFDNGFQAVILHRKAHWWKKLGLPIVAPWLARLNILLTGVDISPRAEIGPGLVISHGVGLVIGGSAVLGERILLHHQVTIGAPTVGRIGQMPTLADDIVVGAGACIIGGVTIGSSCFVGANALVTEDMPPNSKATVPPATITSR